MSTPLLEVKDLRTYFFTDVGVVKAVDGISFHIDQEETLGIVGESGCGKSVASLSIMRLIPSPPGKIVSGDIIINGENILKRTNAQMREIRGNEISMIFQEPMTSLNPVHRVGKQIAEAIMLHQAKRKREAYQQAEEMLRKVGIPLPQQRSREFPHQLSGGMRQRVMIAMALSCNPKLLIADEPTTALDVTIEAQILELMKELKHEFGTAIMLITHDLGVIAEISDRVMVMYASKIVEYADVKTLFKKPLHPYTWGLMNSMPRLTEKKKRLEAINGMVPAPYDLPDGCSFHPRCKFADGICREAEPEIEEVEQGHQVRCWHYQRLYEVRNKSA